MNKKNIILSVLVILFLSCIFFYSGELGALLKQALYLIEQYGWIGKLAFMVIYILSCVFFIPASILTLGAGGAFGLLYGCILVSLSSTIGACLSFLIGRYFLRSTIEKKVEKNEKFYRLDKAIAHQGRKIVFLTRLSPVFPFNLLNYVFGITKINFLDYAIASFIGMMPGTIMYVYIGSLANVISSSGDTTVSEWVMRIIGLFATIFLSFYITSIAKKSFSQTVK